MGYDVHITRKESWADVGADVSESEWHRYITSDPTIDLDPEQQTCTPDGDWRPMPVWFEHPARPWFAHEDGGGIHTKNPDGATVKKMCEIAAALGATVQGDDGEIFVADADGRIFVEEDGNRRAVDIDSEPAGPTMMWADSDAEPQVVTVTSSRQPRSSVWIAKIRNLFRRFR